ncbi:MAG TPA: hypothetical protein VFR84_01155 [Candidatus Angelobacter sp.]|nr:hypothetical protein [Candidatus Angelobacter sp.]
MKLSFLRQPTAFVPFLMSGTALGIVLGYAAIFGVARQADEGTAAHLWQLLMAGQIPLIVLFVLRWFPADPKRSLRVLALQIGAALAAMFPVWWFHW